jgi:hypothetical protein
MSATPGTILRVKRSGLVNKVPFLDGRFWFIEFIVPFLVSRVDDYGVMFRGKTHDANARRDR